MPLAEDEHPVGDPSSAPGNPAMVLVIWIEDVDRSVAELTAAGVPCGVPEVCLACELQG